ncbi:MAG TPA: hypothetical protein VK875_08215 [Euzebyales bacterium]|nr:hypothetical protein [Euzebyales bacterium]
MTTTTTRRSPAPWRLALLAAILIGVLTLLTIGIELRGSPGVGPAAPARVAPATAPLFADEHLERAARVRAAQRELQGWRELVRTTPSTREAARYRMTVLRLVSTRQVPVEALDPAR